MKLSVAARTTVALLLPPVVGGVVWLALLRPLAEGAITGLHGWRAEETALARVADHAEELASGHLVDATEQVGWLRDRLRPGAAATFLEEVARVATALAIDTVEVRRPGTENDPATGLHLEQVALRVIAPYAKVVALWDRLQQRQETAVCHWISLRRYGDQVAATFQVALPVDPGGAS